MKKKVVVLILALFVLLPVSGVFAQINEDNYFSLTKHGTIFDISYEVNDVIDITYSMNNTRAKFWITNQVTTSDQEKIFIFSSNGSNEGEITSLSWISDRKSDKLFLGTWNDRTADIRIYKIKLNDDVVFDGLNVVDPEEPKPELEEIEQVNAEASHDRIDLSWSLPETEYFEHVNIYRKSVSEVQTFNLLSVDEYDPLFETNGTYFNDLTVEEQTTYDYKLTTEFQGLESEGVTVQATTLAAPPPELGGQEFEEQDNGDYLVTWQQPETGQVRILVDGQEYVVVPATDKQYTIPAADMKYTALGDPLVGLQTIGDNGEESEVEQQESNVNLPFGINELLTTSAGLLRVIGSLILLGLSFILVPKFIKAIKQSLSNKNNAETERTEREQRVSDRAYREPRETRISTREGRTSTRVPREFRKGE